MLCDGSDFLAGSHIPEFEGVAGGGQEFAAVAEIDAVDTAVMAGQYLDLVPGAVGLYRRSWGGGGGLASVKERTQQKYT